MKTKTITYRIKSQCEECPCERCGCPLYTGDKVTCDESYVPFCSQTCYDQDANDRKDRMPMSGELAAMLGAWR